MSFLKGYQDGCNKVIPVKLFFARLKVHIYLYQTERKVCNVCMSLLHYNSLTKRYFHMNLVQFRNFILDGSVDTDKEIKINVLSKKKEKVYVTEWTLVLNLGALT